jgi:hypothetical protein
LVTLLFRLEAGPGPEDLVDLVDEIIAWFRQYPDYETLKQLFTEIVGHALSEQDGFASGQTALSANDLLEGREQAVDEGRTQALAETLSKQLRRRLGELSPDVADRIQSANAEELDAWLDRLMDAATISDVFDGNRLN